MAARHVFCGIDVGTQGVRAVLLDEHGELAGQGGAALSSVRHTVGGRGRHEQDPDAWWTALVGAVRAALADASDDGPAQVEALALDATSGTVLVEDVDGRPRGPALMYDDARATEQADRAQDAGSSLWAQLGYRMQASWALPKMLWLLEHGAVRAGDRLVHQSDHLVRRLVGAPVATDTSNALKTGADLRDASWPTDVLGELGLNPARLPALCLPGTPLGAVGAAAARETGLSAGTPVLAGMTDGCAAQIATAALRPGRWSSALGTTLTIKGATRDLLQDGSGAVYSHRHPDGGWLPGGASNSGAGVLDDRLPGRDLAGLTAAAAALVPLAEVGYPLRGTGERFPFVDARAHGIVPPGTGDDARAFAVVCQGVAFVERLAYDVLGLLGADTRGPVALTGGATGNPWWNRLRADVLGRQVVLPRGASAASGMAVLAAAPAGELTRTAERMVRIEATIDPDPERGAQLAASYARFVADLGERGWLSASVAEPVLGAVTASPGPTASPGATASAATA